MTCIADYRHCNVIKELICTQVWILLPLSRLLYPRANKSHRFSFLNMCFKHNLRATTLGSVDFLSQINQYQQGEDSEGGVACTCMCICTCLGVSTMSTYWYCTLQAGKSLHMQLYNTVSNNSLLIKYILCFIWQLYIHVHVYTYSGVHFTPGPVRIHIFKLC